MSRICSQLQLEQKILSSDIIECLQSHGWPGNVRELNQILEEVSTQACYHQTLFSYHLPNHIRVLQAQGILEKADSFPESDQGNTHPQTHQTVPMKNGINTRLPSQHYV